MLRVSLVSRGAMNSHIYSNGIQMVRRGRIQQRNVTPIGSEYPSENINLDVFPPLEREYKEIDKYVPQWKRKIEMNEGSIQYTLFGRILYSQIINKMLNEA